MRHAALPPSCPGEQQTPVTVLAFQPRRKAAPNPDHYCVCLAGGTPFLSTAMSSPHDRAAVLRAARWRPGHTIGIRFLHGHPQLQRRVIEAACEWLDVAELNFEFRDQGPADVRIAFMPGNGSWSHLGTTCRHVPEPAPTMNFGWLTPDSADDDLRRIVLHEFGHALGLVHQHLGPKGGIKWNREAVIADLSSPPNNWDPATIEDNLFRFYPETDEEPLGVVDARSIMLYPIPGKWTLDGFSAGLNHELSSKDQALVKSVYRTC